MCDTVTALAKTAQQFDEETVNAGLAHCSFGVRHATDRQKQTIDIPQDRPAVHEAHTDFS